MEATIRKDDENQVTLILDGYLDTSVTPQTEKEVEPLYQFSDCEIVIDIKGMQEKVKDVFLTTGFTNLFEFK